MYTLHKSKPKCERELIIISLLIFTLGTVVVGTSEFCKPGFMIGNISQTYSFSVNSTKPCNFIFKLNFTTLNETEIMSLRYDIFVEIDPAYEEAKQKPLMISLRQQLTSTQIKLPFSFSNEHGENPFWYYSTRRTLCFPKPKYGEDSDKIKEDSIVHIAFETSNAGGLPIQMRIEKANDLLMRVGDERTTQVNPLAPAYYRFDYDLHPFPSMIEIISQSNDIGKDVCTIVAIDDPFCPVYDTHESIGRVTEYKRMTSAAVTRLRKVDFPKGITIILIPLGSDKDCSTERDWKLKKNIPQDLNDTRTKVIKLKLRAVEKPNVEWMFGLQILGIFVPCIVATLIVFCIFDRKLKRDYADNIKNCFEINNKTTIDPDGDDSDQGSPEQRLNFENEVQEEELTYHGIVKNADTYGNSKRYHQYCTATVFVSVFYIIPVYQFLYYHWKSMSESGNFDHCYYNELCRIRVEDLSDFNHLVSNFLYIVFGLTFILIVYWRSWTLFNKKEYRATHRGLCVPFGAYIAMGLSLIMEGVLSSAYHLCPSSSTFQFDVAFMYVIAIILLSTIYQLRYHASPSGTKAFILLTILTITSAIFYVVETKWSERTGLITRLVFASLHILFTFTYCVGLYYHGTIKDEKGEWMMNFYKGVIFVLTPASIRKKLKRKQLTIVTRSDSKARNFKKFMTIALFVLNSGASIHLALHEDFAHYLLNLLIFNVVLALTSYIAWKIFYWNRRPNSEGSGSGKWFSPYCLQTIFYLLLGVLFFTCAFRKFNINLTEWRASAAESRSLNKPCSEFYSGYYDLHDVWHFFSAAALFFFFMGLLTIDDGLLMVDRKNIKIF